jgi:UDP-glucose:glycoprotein glucosyltransferase
MYPGQLPNVKLNLFNIVLVLDFTNVQSLQFVTGPMANIVNRNYPLRFGVVPIVAGGGDGGEDDGTRMARLFYYLIHQYGRKTTLEFIKQVYFHNSYHFIRFQTFC